MSTWSLEKKGNPAIAPSSCDDACRTSVFLFLFLYLLRAVGDVLEVMTSVGQASLPTCLDWASARDFHWGSRASTDRADVDVDVDVGVETKRKHLQRVWHTLPAAEPSD